MKYIAKFRIIAILFIYSTLSYGQFAEPAVTGAVFVPDRINLDEKSELKFSFVNSGSTSIPVGSIELIINCPEQIYGSEGIVAPYSKGNFLFDWEYVLLDSGLDVWRGVNSTVIPPFSGELISLDVTGVIASTDFKLTKITVAPIDNLHRFLDATLNNTLKPRLFVSKLVSTEDVQMSSNIISIFPNPTVNHFMLDYYLEKPGKVSVKIKDMSGYKWGNIKFSNKEAGEHHEEISFENYPEGVFILTIDLNGKVFNRRLIHIGN